MANNKVQLANGTILIDLTKATAKSDKILSGYTAYGADGELIVGTATDCDTITTDVLNKNYINVNLALRSGVKFFRCSTTPNSAMTSGQTYPVGTLTQQFRPLYNITQYVIGSSGVVQGYFYLSTSGNVSFKALANIPKTTGINMNLAYL